MRLLISVLVLLVSFNVFGVTEDQFFAKPEVLKKSKFYYPVITLNNEIGQRFAFFPLDDTPADDDFEITDSYNFTLGYYKIMQQLSKTSKVRFKYSFNNKEYDVERELNNNSRTISTGLVWEFLPTITSDVFISYREKDFVRDNEKDNYIASPGIELKARPKKGILIGLKYVFLRTDYIDTDKDSKGNRMLVYWQEGFYDGHLRIRARYRVENRNYEEPTKSRKNSTRQSVSLTAKIDFN